MAVRRSARLRSTSAEASESTEPQGSVSHPDPVARLPSVVEGEEAGGMQSPHFRTPKAKNAHAQKTPNTSTRKQPVETKTPTSARLPGHRWRKCIRARRNRKDVNGNVVKDSVADNTPTKPKASPATSQFGTPGYEFKFSCQEAQLSDEAKRLMDSVREDVARIKSQMVQDRSKQNQDAEKQVHGDRKIAMPKGKAGRFSDVHMAEFKRMDSIAGHPSSFRATPGRFQPVTQSLKRTKSKAQLDEPDSQSSSPSRSTVKPTAAPTPVATAKRIKHNTSDDATTVRSIIEKTETPPKPAPQRIRPAVRSSLMTPTRSSIARSASHKAPKTSLIPSLQRSPSTKNVSAPRTPRTEFNPRLKSNLPSLGNLKSILRRHQPLFSRDPAKIAAGTHVPAPNFDPDTLMEGTEGPAEAGPTPSPKKHVEFTPSVKSRHELTQASPSPSKVPSKLPRSTSSNVLYPALPTLTPEENTTAKSFPAKSPTIRQVRQSDTCAQPSYPELPVVAHGIAHGIGNKKRHRDDDDDDTPNAEDAENVPPADEQSDERSAKRVKANPPTPSPVKPRVIKTPVRSTPGRMGTPASAKSRSVLRLSRLNMLAKPKGRT
ncbi:hypothetical protein N7474_004227 [Penicillium riverlandense]|uniref:uncharacterized protein n=1 Tax=Penicillium riverlandense TaxID=1903569 RepID=UPI002547DBFB|nr:uncharacterized protein N7474_004227 [Penicillium riverlandense]KAJ5818636.1 hypothetical protein N7474_004227 [Penicillium riverlandense]